MPGFDTIGHDDFARLETPLSASELKFAVDAPAGTFEGYAAVFNVKDKGRDLIKPGAFKDTLREWRRKSRYPKMLSQHGGWFMSDMDGIPVGKWEEMREDDRGLWARGRLINLDTERGSTLYGAMKEGVLEGMSIGYVAKEYEVGTKPNEPRRTLKKIDLREVSLVTFPMNDMAQIVDVKSMVAPEHIRDFEGFLRDVGLSQSDSKKAVSAFKSWLRRDVAAPYPEEPREEGSPEEMAIVEKLKRSSEGLRRDAVVAKAKALWT